MLTECPSGAARSLFDTTPLFFELLRITPFQRVQGRTSLLTMTLTVELTPNASMLSQLLMLMPFDHRTSFSHLAPHSITCFCTSYTVRACIVVFLRDTGKPDLRVPKGFQSATSAAGTGTARMLLFCSMSAFKGKPGVPNPTVSLMAGVGGPSEAMIFESRRL